MSVGNNSARHSPFLADTRTIQLRTNEAQLLCVVLYYHNCYYCYLLYVYCIAMLNASSRPVFETSRRHVVAIMRVGRGVAPFCLHSVQSKNTKDCFGTQVHGTCAQERYLIKSLSYRPFPLPDTLNIDPFPFW